MSDNDGVFPEESLLSDTQSVVMSVVEGRSGWIRWDLLVLIPV